MKGKNVVHLQTQFTKAFSKDSCWTSEHRSSSCQRHTCVSLTVQKWLVTAWDFNFVFTPEKQMDEFLGKHIGEGKAESLKVTISLLKEEMDCVMVAKVQKSKFSLAVG